MSRVLLIRHLPRTLSLQEKNELLRHYGAEKVWELTSRKDVVFASFATHEAARSSLLRLHQLELCKRRLVVEYSEQKVPHGQPEDDEKITEEMQKMKDFLKQLYALNPSVNFFQPPPPHIRYKYPEPTPTIFINIVFAMSTHRPLYTQVLHLMNKMSLDPPFKENSEAINYFHENFKMFFTDHSIAQPDDEPSESEISSGDENKSEKPAVAKLVKRKHLLPQTRKRPATILSTASIPGPNVKKKKVIDQKEIFEEVNLHEQKKILVNVPQDTLTKQQSQSTEVVGEIKKLIVERSNENKTEECKSVVVPSDKQTISRKILIKNRVSFNDMKVLPVFKNYHPGEPSMRLYLKNLSKTATEDDIKNIYSQYVEELPSLEKQGFDVRVMQEGRMKGQGFVTFPSVQIAKLALQETNGYLLNDKPMVVQFARVANKKL